MWSFANLALAAEPSEVAYVGADTVVTAHLSAPMPMGASVRVTPGGRGDRARFGVEASGGVHLITESVGIGPRLVITVNQDLRGDDAFVVTPGLDLYFLLMDPNYGDGWFSGPYSDSTYLGGTVELGWTHQFRPRLGFDLGLRGGATVGVGGYSSPQQSVRGDVLPHLALFSGLRF